MYGSLSFATMGIKKFQNKQENSQTYDTASGNISPYSSDYYQEQPLPQEACPECQGIGWVYGEDNETCILCNGQGLL